MGEGGGHAVTRVVATTRTMTISFYFRSIPFRSSEGGRRSPLLSFPFAPSLLFSRFGSCPLSSGSLRSFLLSLLSKIFFFLLHLCRDRFVYLSWNVSILREFFAIVINNGAQE